MTYSDMALYDVMNVTGTVLVKFQVVTGTFLWKSGDEMTDEGVKGRTENDDGHVD